MGWELVANDPDGSPRQVNGPYPTAGDSRSGP